MLNLLFFCAVLTLVLIFLIIYSSTLHLFPREWRDKVNSNNNSLNPRYNNESLTGILIIILAAIVIVMWSIYFYISIFS